MPATQSRDPLEREDAVAAPASADIELAEVLTRIVVAACELVDARYGALGVLDRDGNGLAEFITHGVSDDERERIGPLPRGRGVLGLLIREPLPLRLDDITTHAESAGVPPGHPPMHTFLGVPIQLRDSVFGNLYLTEKRGGEKFTAGDEAVVVGLAAVAGLAIENARLLERSRQQSTWLETSAELTRRLFQGIPEPEVLTFLADQVRAHVRSAAVAVSIYDAAGELRVVARSPAPGDTSAPEVPRDEGTPALVTPITVGTERIGELEVRWEEGEPLPESRGEVVTQLVAQVAAQTGLALTASRAQQDRSRLAVVEDRDRIARDMHDHVIQRLFATGLSLQAAERFATHPLVMERLEEAVDSLDIAIKDIRQTIFELHRTRAASDFRADLAQVVGDAEVGLGFAAVLRVSEHLDGLGAALEADILAVVREGLTNVARHARAGAAEVTVQRADGEVTVEVRDDGLGIGSRDERRSGLANLADRATARRGHLRTGPTEGGGTSLVWHVPVPHR